MQSQWPEAVQNYIDAGMEAAQQKQAHQKKVKTYRFDTLAVHGLYSAQDALNNQGSIIEPAFLSPAQHFENSDHMEAALAYQMPSWTYTRIANPTVGYLEDTLAMMEVYGSDIAASACATTSGMSAIFMATNPFLINPDRKSMNIVASSKCYGGTFMLFQERYANERGVEVRWVKNPLDLDEWAQHIDSETRFVFGEMPSNPGLAVFDIAKLSELAHQHSAPLIVDSTVASPALMRPLCFGADIVVQSVSKAMASSGLAIAGALIAKHNLISNVVADEMKQNFALNTKLLPFRDHGPGLSPFNALMVLTDLRTLRSKIDLMSQNAMAVASFLDGHANVETVSYPGLLDHPSHKLAKQHMQLVDCSENAHRYGYLMSFNVKGGAAPTRKVFDQLQIIFRATDLGRIKSVATIPAISTHQQQGESGRALGEVADNQIRLAVGGESVEDIIQDLDQALAQA